MVVVVVVVVVVVLVLVLVPGWLVVVVGDREHGAHLPCGTPYAPSAGRKLSTWAAREYGVENTTVCTEVGR